MTLPIWIPCESFDVELSAEDAGPTGLEKAALLFLAARGDALLSDIDEFLGLGERLTMDLITDLWTLGYILVDAVKGGLRLDPTWEPVVQAGEWARIASAHLLSERMSMMRELVSGQLVEDLSQSAAPSPESAAPALVSSKLLGSVDRRDLTVAALRSPTLGAALRSRSRNLRARFVRSEEGGVARSLTWLCPEFEASTDDGAEIALTVTHVPSDDPTIDRIGPGIARALTDWAQANALHPLVQALLKQARPGGSRPRPSLVKRLRDLDRNLGEAMENHAASRPNIPVWTATLASMGDEIDALEGSVIDGVKLHTGQAAQKAFVECSASVFEQQLVVTVPRLDFDGLAPFTAAIAERLGNAPSDAGVFLLWGADAQAAMSEGCQNELGNRRSFTQSGSGQRLHFSNRSSRIASALAIVDGDSVLYSNVSPLDSRTSPETFAYSLEIGVPAQSTLARQALEIIHSRAPDFAIADRLDLRPQRVKAPLWNAPLSPFEPQMDGAAGDDHSQEDAPGADFYVKAEIFELRRKCRAALDRLAATGAVAELLTDSALFQRALDIVSDSEPNSVEGHLWLGFGRDYQLRRSVPLHRKLVDGLGQRARLGLPTTVLVEDQDRSSGVDLAGLRDMAASHPDSIHFETVKGLVGSFLCGDLRFLTSSGGLAAPAGVEPNRLASRVVGVSVTDEAHCAAFKEALVQRWPALQPCLKAPAPTRTPRASSARTDRPRPVTAAVGAWQRAPDGQRRLALASAVAQVDGGVDRDMIDSLLELTAGDRTAGSGGFELRQDVLEIAALHGSDDLAAAARRELTLNAWRRGAWQQAAILLAAAPEHDLAVPIDFALAAADVDAHLEVERVPDLIERSDPDGWIAIVALAIKAVITNGDHEMAGALDVKLSMDEGPPEAAALRKVGLAVVQHWQATGGQIDSGRLRALIAKRHSAEELGRLAAQLTEEFRSANRLTSVRSVMTRVPNGLYQTTLGLGDVLKVLQASDGKAISDQDWLKILRLLVQRFGRDRIDIPRFAQSLLDDAWREFSRPQEEPIFGAKRTSHLTQLRRILVPAIALRDALLRVWAGHDDENPGLVELLDTLQAQATSLSGIGPGLAEDAIARPVVEDLDALVRQLTATP